MNAVPSEFKPSDTYHRTSGNRVPAAPAILIIDDDQLICRTLENQLQTLGYRAVTATDGASGHRLVAEADPAMVLLDLCLPDTDGITLLGLIRDLRPDLPVVMISGQGTIPDAVRALRSGAEDFLVKPVDMTLLESVVKRTLQHHQTRRENARLKQLAGGDKTEFIGESPEIRKLLADADIAAKSDHPILVEGETGTGKQVLASHIFSRSNRAGEPFVNVNCAAITPTLFESELFGHEKGAFTGAIARKDGKLELVGNGTLFLDEIGELPIACQAKLLMAVEERIFERVGGTRPLTFQGRIIAATNRDLEKETAAGNFRRDLFFRLNTIRLKIPPLREHPDDIPLFIARTLDRCSRTYGVRYTMPDSAVMNQVKEYSWPGNVRELIHHVERIALFTRTIDIPKQLWLSFQPAGIVSESAVMDEDLRSAEEQFRRQHLQRVLTSCGGNQTEAARRLGISRSYLNRLLAGERADR